MTKFPLLLQDDKMGNMVGKAKIPRGPKISVEVPAELLKRAKHLAIDADSNLREVIAKALEEYLQKQEKKGVRR